jgi:hypothetical protein
MEESRHERGAGVPLGWVGADLWSGAKHQQIQKLDPETGERFLPATEGGDSVVWIQFGLPHASADAVEWFEGSQDAWASGVRPEVDWRAVRPVLDWVRLSVPGVPAEGPDERSQSLLCVLPYLYGQGIFRAEKDAPDCRRAPDVLMFPTAGFLPDSSERLATGNLNRAVPRFWMLRMNVGVVDNVVITIRLQDLLCTGFQPDAAGGGDLAQTERSDHIYRSGVVQLSIPDRFFPSGQPKARDIAEGIALHQAATAREAADRLRDRLREMERDAISRSHDPEHTQASQESILEINSTVDQLDRQLSRLLRRFGADGEWGEGDARQLVPPEAKLRYRFAVDEIHSLRNDCRLAEDALKAQISNRDRDDRDRFELAVALVTSAVLIPTLVAGVYGANVSLPRHLGGFVALMLFIIGFAAAGIFALDGLRSRPALLKTVAARAVIAAFAVLCVLGGLTVVLEPLG